MTPLAPELDHLAAAAPEAGAALVGAWRAAHDAVDPELLALAGRRVEAQLGLVDNHGEEPADPLGQAIAALTDQFVFYVPDVGPELRDPVGAHLGPEGLSTFVQALYVLDQTARLRLSHARLFAGEEAPRRPPLDPGPPRPLADAISEMHASAMRLYGLDALTTETVRLRAANYHACDT